jgi:ribosomal protein L7/L12
MNIQLLIASMSKQEQTVALNLLRQIEQEEIVQVAESIELNYNEINLIRKGGIANKIEAVKAVRNRLGCGLRIAKEAVDLLQKELTI